MDNEASSLFKDTLHLPESIQERIQNAYQEYNRTPGLSLQTLVANIAQEAYDAGRRNRLTTQ